MYFDIRKVCTIFFMIFFFSFHIHTKIDSALSSPVLSQLQTALQDLIKAYDKNNMPIEFEDSNIVCTTFRKLTYPYVLYISTYASTVMSQFARNADYAEDLQKLSTDFVQYQNDVKSYVALFPQANQKDAWEYFYNQLTDSVVQNCYKILQSLSYTGHTDDTSLSNAKAAFFLAWSCQTPTMKLSSVSSVDDFKTTIVNNIVSLYQLAIKNRLQKINYAVGSQELNQKIYTDVASYYTEIASVYTASGDSAKAALQKKEAGNIQAIASEFKQAAAAVASADQDAQAARTAIIIDYAQASSTLSSVETSLKKFSSAITSYEQAGNLYNQAENSENSVGYTMCLSKKSEVLADQLMRTIQKIWLELLLYKDDSSDAISSTIQAFYAQNVASPTISAKTMIAALTVIQQVCTKPSNSVNKFSLQQVIQAALQTYKAAGITHPTTSQDSLAGTDLLHTLKTAMTYLTTIINQMIEIEGSTSGSSIASMANSVVTTTKKLDALYSQTKELKEYLFYFPSIESSTATYHSFFCQYLYQLFAAKGLSMIAAANKEGSSSTSYYQTMLQALQYFNVLQTYSDMFSSDQNSLIEKTIATISKDIDIAKEAKTAYTKAQQSNNWKNTQIASSSQVYSSQSDMLWKDAIHLYEIALQLASAKITTSSVTTLQKTYIQVLQGYVEAFMKNVTAYTGYQLHVAFPLYQVYLGAIQVKDQSVQASIETIIANKYGSSNGFFDQVNALASEVKSDASNTQKVSDLEKTMTQVIAMFDAKVEEQASIISRMQKLFGIATKPSSLLEKVINKDSVELKMTIGSNNYSCSLVDATVVATENLKTEEAEVLQKAQQADSSKDYATATTEYNKLQTIYSKLYQNATTSSDKNSYKQKYFLSKTLYTANSLASLIIVQGAQTLGKLTTVPVSYEVTEFQQSSIEMSLFASQIPSSLQNISSSSLQPITQDDEKKEVIAIFKAFLIAQMLQPQGLDFKSCYKDYTLDKASGLDATDASIAASIEKQVSEYIDQMSNVTVLAQVKDQSISILFKNMPIPTVTPLYANGPCTDVYLVGASTLFAPGTKLIAFGGNGMSYVPGQDQQATNNMYEELAYAYTAEAAKNITTASTALKAAVDYVTTQVKDKKTVSKTTFLNQYTIAKKSFIRAQALLFATNASAYYYFTKAGQASTADQIRTIFINLYENQIDSMKKILIGNPFSSVYTLVLSDINQLYITWNSELGSLSDTAQITKNKEAIIQLYTAAAESCMTYQFVSETIPGIEQYSYMAAGADYTAAQKAYTSAGYKTEAAALSEKINKAYLLACNQNIALYKQAKSGGVVYTPDQSCQSDQSQVSSPIKTTLSNVNQNYQRFTQDGTCMDDAEMQVYHRIKSLLIDAAMYYQNLSSTYQKLAPAPPAATAKKSSSTTSTKSKNPLNKDLLVYLQSTVKGNSNLPLVTKKNTTISYTDTTIRNKIFTLSLDVYNHFIATSNYAAIASWMNVLFNAVQFLYIDDYLGGVSDNQISNKVTEFFQAIKKEASDLQNPSSAYVG